MSEAGSMPPTLRPDELMTDEDFVKAIEAMDGQTDGEISELLKAMNENRIISWEEAERILMDTGTAPVKSSLPEQTRPSEPDNDTDVDQCVQRLLDNDPTLKEVNMNNMKRTPIPQIRRLLEALAYNEHCERLSLANMGLYDNDVAVLLPVIEMNTALKKLNLETNYLSGDFFAKLFRAALVNQTLEEVKAVNQGVSFATMAEKEIIDCIVANTGLTKISVNLRLPEGRHKVENATLRNGEYKRILRREAAKKAKWEAEELAKNPVPHLPKEPPKKEPPKTPAAPAPAPAVASKPPAAKEPLAKAKEPAPKPSLPNAKKPPVTKPVTTNATTPTVSSSAKEKPSLKPVAKKFPVKDNTDQKPVWARRNTEKPKDEPKPPMEEKKPLIPPTEEKKPLKSPTEEKKPLVFKKKNEDVDKTEETKPTKLKMAALSRKPRKEVSSATPVSESGVGQDRLRKAQDTAKKLTEQKENAPLKPAVKPDEKAKGPAAIDRGAKVSEIENGPVPPAKKSDEKPKKTVSLSKDEKPKKSEGGPASTAKKAEGKVLSDKALDGEKKAKETKAKKADTEEEKKKAENGPTPLKKSNVDRPNSLSIGDKKQTTAAKKSATSANKVSPTKRTTASPASTVEANGNLPSGKKPTEELKKATAKAPVKKDAGAKALLKPKSTLPQAAPEGELSPEHEAAAPIAPEAKKGLSTTPRLAAKGLTKKKIG
ncbi:unnamed protein product [Nippostrongylus brasiliensis]|uniref:Tropomodulin n=1 Tax=Nippostrongylus brasiliensis TaxID=27835 RepID=A0A0N4YLK4_NIPBR|nr:unnamed protein product [Nippostrongylus brasiliensis]